jgi:hypothetical protein
LVRTVYIWCVYGIFGREITKIYGHIRCINTALANPVRALCMTFYSLINFTHFDENGVRGLSNVCQTFCMPPTNSGQPYIFYIHFFEYHTQMDSLTRPAAPRLRIRVGQNHIYTVHIRYFWPGNSIFTVIYGVYIQLWPALLRIQFGTILYNLVQFGAIWYNSVQYGTVWCNLRVQFGTIWYNLRIQFGATSRIDVTLSKSIAGLFRAM